MIIFLLAVVLIYVSLSQALIYSQQKDILKVNKKVLKILVAIYSKVKKEVEQNGR